MNEQVTATRARIAQLGAILFERRLLDMGGGNISVRVGDVLCFSPAYSGSLRQWQLKPEDVLVIDLASGSILEGAGKLSRESNVHLSLHRNFREHGTAVIHAHAQNIMVFAVMNKPMPAVMEATLKFGEIKVIDYAPAHTPNLAENVTGAIRGQEERIKKHAAAVIAPWHGIFVMGKDFDAAADALERLDTNARCLLLAHQMPGASTMLATESAQLVEAAQKFNKAI